jgi:ribosomal-protein-alanine N-acetyltransferase
VAELIVSPMTVGDLDEVIMLERQSFTDPWSRRMYQNDLTHNELATYLVLRPDATGLPPVLAYGGFWLMVDQAHIATLASHPAWRGCGLGQWILVALLEAARARGAARATLEVRAGNHTAQRLYEKLGFEVAGKRRHYYRDGEDGVVMTTEPLDAPEMCERIEMAFVDARARAAQCLAVRS